jgi:AGZA family xanthine/uracil permease-like MFS transporter
VRDNKEVNAMFEPQASIAVPKHESAVDRFFEISKRGSTYKREILAGLTTFLVGAYIIFVNPTVLSLTGLPGLQGKGGPFIPLVAATCLTAGVMTLLMGLYGKYPLMMAPGMGLNAFVAYSLVATGKLTYGEAMGVILLEGVAITILVLTGLRQALMNAIPLRLKLSIGVGIGLFIALIGFVDAGFVKVGVASTPLSLGSLAQGSVAVAVFGLLLMAMLQVKKVKGSLLIGILATTVFAIVLNALTGGQTFASVPGVAVVPTKVVELPDFSTLGLGLNVGVFAKVGVLAA